jgi:preprotein translocase subunit SecD
MRAAIPIILLAVGCAGGGVRPLEIHLADYQAAPGRKAFTPEPGEALLYMEPKSVLDDRDFVSVRAATDRFGQPALELCLSPGGKEKFQRAAAENVGRRLIFLVQGNLVMSPQIGPPGTPLECVTVEGQVTSADADVLSRAIGRR